MKHYLSLIGAVLMLAAVTSQAQTNGIPSDIIQLGQDLGNGPWGIGSGYGHSISGTGKNIAFAVVTYDLVTNANNTGFSSGLIAGYDDLWTSSAKELNSVSGGWQMSFTGNPLSFIGSTALTNLVATVTGYQLIATPQGGNDIGSITGTSLSIHVGEWSGFHLNVVGLYEDRNGQGSWNGNYLLGGLFITHKF